MCRDMLRGGHLGQRVSRHAALLTSPALVFVSVLQVTSALGAGIPEIDVDSAAVEVTGKATVTIRLASNGSDVGGVQNVIVFDNTVLALPISGCTIYPAIGLSPGGADCTSDTTVGPCKNLIKSIHQCGSSPEPSGCPGGSRRSVLPCGRDAVRRLQWGYLQCMLPAANTDAAPDLDANPDRDAHGNTPPDFHTNQDSNAHSDPNTNLDANDDSDTKRDTNTAPARLRRRLQR